VQLRECAHGGPEATYRRDRRVHLARANLGLEKRRFFFRLAHEQHHLDTRRYEHAARAMPIAVIG
jgi:hypothetical protein